MLRRTPLYRNKTGFPHCQKNISLNDSGWDLGTVASLTVGILTRRIIRLFQGPDERVTMGDDGKECEFSYILEYQ